MKEPALAMLEFKSVARGVFVTDAIVKKAGVRLLDTHPMCPGKYMILFSGEVGEVEESFAIGEELGGDLLINSLLLPHVHKSIIPAISGTTDIETFGALGLVETFSIASCVVAADKAAKMTPVKLVEIRLANGLGGKGYFVMTGSLEDIEASMETAVAHIRGEGLLADSEIIPNPHPDLIARGVYW